MGSLAVSGVFQLQSVSLSVCDVMFIEIFTDRGSELIIWVLDKSS